MSRSNQYGRIRRRTSGRQFSGLLSGLLLVGCHGFRAEASVASRTEGSSELRPLSGASLSYDCPQVLKAPSRSFLGRTDAGGHLAVEEPAGGRWLHDGCTVHVEKAGFVEQHYDVARVCTAYSGNHCLQIDLLVLLRPIGSPG